MTETCAHALRAFQTIAERQHEGRVFDATVAKWCRVSAATLSDTSKPKRGDRNKQTCESLGMLLAACGSFAGRCGISGDVNALVVAVNETIASDTVSFGKNATAHDAQRVLVGWRKIKLNAVSSSPNPNAVAAVIASVKRVLPQELDSQTIHDIVSGLAALSGSEITLAEATQATLRRRARDDAHAAASRLCLQGLRAFDEPVAPADLAESALLATLQTAKAANHLEGAYIAKAARAWARLAHAAGNFPDPSAVATTLAALHDAQPTSCPVLPRFLGARLRLPKRRRRPFAAERATTRTPPRRVCVFKACARLTNRLLRLIWPNPRYSRLYRPPRLRIIWKGRTSRKRPGPGRGWRTPRGISQTRVLSRPRSRRCTTLSRRRPPRICA